MSIYAKLSAIQAELNAPKAKGNEKLRYMYRSAESILQALKPHLQKHEVVVVISDEIIQVSERFYIKATVKLMDGKDCIETSALAREELTSKIGMAQAQITGATSSYARKYALCGMFAIDDNKDADSLNDGSNHYQHEQAQYQQYVETHNPLLTQIAQEQGTQALSKAFEQIPASNFKKAFWKEYGASLKQLAQQRDKFNTETEEK